MKRYMVVRSCGYMGILCGFPQVLLWMWDGYRDWNSIPTAAPEKHVVSWCLNCPHLMSGGKRDSEIISRWSVQ